MSKALITLNDLAIGYEGRVVLEHLNCGIREGAFTGLMGANGSGKTTLLKTIAGIQKPLAGQVVFPSHTAGEPMLGYVPQRETFDPVFLLSVFEVAQMGVYGRIAPGRSLGRQEKEHVRECLRQTGVEELSPRLFSQLSGGQKQRVLIARALAGRPDCLLLDEPTAGIDPAASDAICELLQTLHARGMTILMVNHELPVTRKLVNDVIWLRRGRIEQGSAADLLSPARIMEMLDLTGSHAEFSTAETR